MRVREVVNRVAAGAAILLLAVTAATPASAEDGYDLWLRYAPLEGEAAVYLQRGFAVEAEMTPTVEVAADELAVALGKMAGSSDRKLPAHPRIVIGTRDRLSPAYSDVTSRLEGLAANAFIIGQSTDGRIVVASDDDLGLLYGVFALTRHLAVHGNLDDVDQASAPAMPLRLLNHWDNPDGHVERGYAGRSIFDWWHLPEKLDPRMIDYARANASIGINGAVVNNVNARGFMLEPRYIAKLQRLADAWRPYGIRVYLSARFSAPVDIGGLDTADPLDPQVAAWWQVKADEIYASIPDFGGFLVKANSEGQPGPQDYGRTHADGANMLAAAIGDRGTVIWRAFVYSAEDETDRAKQAYEEFVPLDGQFADNVIVQVKNGPVDFQPREPFHPMFGAMPNTRLMLELQITREYLGQATGAVYLAPMWTEVLDARTGRGGSVARIVAPVGVAGVANTGSARNWTGTHFDQANWYAFGRLAWDPTLTSKEIAREWVAQTFVREPGPRDAIAGSMEQSRESVVRYMTPFGLAHLMATGHHYGPAPWVCDLARPEWNPCYYHRADADGIGFDRTANGSDALAQYAPEVASQWADPAAIDEDYLLWFHHVPWDHRMKSGRTLWEELVASYGWGELRILARIQGWQKLAPFIDAERHAAVAADLAIQLQEARWWRDASIAYWQSVNGLDLPPGTRPPEHDLEYYRKLDFPEAPGQ
ncbi:alpha-glucuronidase [Alteriqipengyuania lutimaris]|uniref:Xylan alpha-1,2-glucuronidase n=2 Tax=Alteriqipengyuania lutimaris TaxID=1538146 RepID=A0A395LPB6_9SPHN|nr:alpha-glucuronidase family glycosyl hydrolase [Alteriqipengyuania lutimaris]RDS78575.1 alpha-glucuronidase [Alteriqipengyuania lutimaris]